MKIKTKTRSLWYGAEGTIPSTVRAAPRVQWFYILCGSGCARHRLLCCWRLLMFFSKRWRRPPPPHARATERFVRFSAICAPRAFGIYAAKINGDSMKVQRAHSHIVIVSCVCVSGVRCWSLAPLGEWPRPDTLALLFVRTMTKGSEQREV
jgi:hypothetical protein